MSSPTEKRVIYEFPTSKAGKEPAPAWFASRHENAQPAAFLRHGGERLAPPPIVPVGLGRGGERLQPPSAMPQLETPVPGSKSVPPPPGAQAPPAELRARIQAFVDAAGELATARAKIENTVEGQVLDLAMEIASTIVDHEVEHDPELHLALAREALKSLGHHGEPTLRASSAAVAAIIDATGSADLDVDGMRVTIQEDPSIDGLGCIAENDHARVDGRVAERLRAVRRAIEDERRRRQREETE